MISIIVLNNQDETYLIRCLNSIMRQTYKDFEIILISGEKHEELKEKYPIKTLQVKATSKYEGINDALKMVSGEFLYFCSITSVLSPTALKELYISTIENPKSLVWASNYIQNGLKYLPAPNMEMSWNGKLFYSRDFIDVVPFYQGTKSFGEFLVILGYLKKYPYFCFAPNVYIYENNDYRWDVSYSRFSDDEWELLISALLELEDDTQSLILNILTTNIEKNDIQSEKLAFMIQQHFPTNYKLNYLVAKPLIKEWWYNVQEKFDDDSLLCLCNYIKSFISNKHFVDQLLNIIGLKETQFSILTSGNAENVVFLLNNYKEDDTEHYISEKIAPLLCEIDNIKIELTRLKENKQILSDVIQPEIKKESPHILELEAYITKECYEGRVGLKTLLKFVNAWMSYKIHKGGK
ncbi:MAG: glycosyltransferase family A protein [Agathobacter sp.]